MTCCTYRQHEKIRPKISTSEKPNATELSKTVCRLITFDILERQPLKYMLFGCLLMPQGRSETLVIQQESGTGRLEL